MGVRSAIIGAALAMIGPVSAADPPPVEDLGWPRTAFQPDFRVAPPAQVPDNPFVEPPVNPFLPRPTISPGVELPDGARVPLPASSGQRVQIGTRYGTPYNLQSDRLDGDTRRVLVTGGVIVSVEFLNGPPGSQQMEFAADTVVAWIRGAGGRSLIGGLDVGASGSGKTDIELYLAGDVVIRTVTPAGSKGASDQVLRAKEIYYDVSNNRAVAVCADLEVRGAGFSDPLHLRSQEIWRLGKNEWRAFDAEASASKRPSDPNLTAGATESTFIQRMGYRTNIFGIPYRDIFTGEKIYTTERTLINRNATVRLFDVPVFYWPKTVSDLAEPFGPFQGIGFGNDNIFGMQLYTTWDVFKLLALRSPAQHNWRLDLDYLNSRGPAIGTQYNYSGLDAFGYGGPQTGLLKFYGINDRALFDQLGGSRGPQPPKPEFRYRYLFRHNQDLYEDGTTYARLMMQGAYLSDKNFLEQYYKQEFDMGLNQETFINLFGASDNLYGSLLAEARIHRPWVTETESLPRLEGALIGQSFLSDRLIYSARTSAGYFNFRPAEEPPFPVLPTDQIALGLGRFNLNQRLSAPFDLSFIRINPYGVVDLTYYTQTLDQTQLNPFLSTGLGQVAGIPWDSYTTAQGNALGRFYGGGGLEASTTASRVYEDVRSELFNLKGLNHKVTLSGNYLAAYSNQPYTRFPQLDRVFDDSLDQGYRNSRLVQTSLIPGPAGPFLALSPIYDPQQYAIRRQVENRIDTLASLQEIQLALKQRLQTKRGFPGMEHTVDWMTLDLSASAFPDPVRDNYGETWSFLEYLYLWHVGDRFSISSAGWYDPFQYGARYWNIGLNFNRPDGTNFFLSYRHTDPLNSRAVTGAAAYQLSSKYALNLSTTYDFGTNEALTNTLSLARTGPDMTTMIGFTYNALVNNFGLQFALLPNLAASANNSQRGFNMNGPQNR